MLSDGTQNKGTIGILGKFLLLYKESALFSIRSGAAAASSKAVNSCMHKNGFYAAFDY